MWAQACSLANWSLLPNSSTEILYGAALATIALTNGSRVNELLQVRLDRRKSRTETVTVIKDGRTEQRRTALHLQHLLPKGARTDEER